MAASKDVEDGKMFAFLAVFLGLIGFLIVFLAKKDNKYAMFYAKQSLVLTIVWVGAWVVSMILAFIPIIGWLAMMVIYICLLVFWVIGWLNALSGNEKPIPIIGKFADKFKL